MLNRLKGAVANARKADSADEKPVAPKAEKYVYARPYFLGMNKDEVENSRDFGMRPIFIPRSNEKAHAIPFNAGYAECINGGKSDYNEDNSYACVLRLRNQQNGTSSPDHVSPDSKKKMETSFSQQNKNNEASLEASYFGVFDGHAGYRVSLIVSRLLNKHLQDKLEACLEYLLPKLHNSPSDPYCTDVTVDDLVIGAFEEAFADMDAQLDRESSNYVIKGGCTALVALFLKNKLYIANAGDCRAVLCQGDKVTQVSRDFNPESERQRLNYLGHCYPELLHSEFSCTEYQRRVNRNDVGKRMLCRKPGMEGWVTKTITEEDLRFPLVIGEGRKARVMGTIGVTRGLGDHDLYVYDSNIWIKPFLSAKPEVRVIDLNSGIWTEDDVLIIGSDGLWDGLTNEEAVNLVRTAIAPPNDNRQNYQKYTIAAQELVCEARGQFTGSGWRKKDNVQASFDDITAFVIPIKPGVEVSETDVQETMASSNETSQNVETDEHAHDAKQERVPDSETAVTDTADTANNMELKEKNTTSSNKNGSTNKTTTEMTNSNGSFVKVADTSNGKAQANKAYSGAKQVCDETVTVDTSVDGSLLDGNSQYQSNIDDSIRLSKSSSSNCSLDKSVAEKPKAEESTQQKSELGDCEKMQSDWVHVQKAP